VLVIDDGSTDKTAEKAIQAGAMMLQHKTNLGKGAALKTGFDYILRRNYDIIVTLDADGQHLPEEIPLLVNKLKEGYDAVIAKRDFRTKKVPFTRKAGNLIDSYILSKLLSEDVYDAQSGFRAFRKDVLLELHDDVDNNGFPYEPELLARLIKNKFKVGWVDITTIYSKDLESKIKPFKHTYESFKLYLKCFMGKI
jgi:glycosyltransferase involved in cell wall biosynthesis